MHLEEALSQTDRAEFIKAVKKELQDHINGGHWKAIPAKHVTKDKIKARIGRVVSNLSYN